MMRRFVDQDERARALMRIVSIADDRLLQRQRHAADVVHRELLAIGRLRQRMHVEHFLDRTDAREHRAGGT